MKKAYKTMDSGRPRKDQIRASEIIRHVMETGKPYPLPAGCGLTDAVFYDVPEFMQTWSLPPWVSLTKTDFASKYQVALPQVTRWIKAGMPEMEDGRLYYEDASEWLHDYREECERRKQSGWRD